MSTEDELRKALHVSECKRAELIIENQRLKQSLEQQWTSSSVGTGSAAHPRTPTPASAARFGVSGSPEPASVDDGALTLQLRNQVTLLERELRVAEAEIASLRGGVHAAAMHDTEAAQPQQQRAAQLPMGFVSITPLPQPSETDFGFSEEEHAKQCAEEIMAQLLRALHAQRQAQQELGASQLEKVQLQSLLDESRGREIVLSQMVSAYSDVVQADVGSSSTTCGGGSGSVTKAPRSSSLASTVVSSAQVEGFLQQCMHNLGRLDGVKRKLIDEKLREVMSENEELKKQLSSGGAAARADGARSAAPIPGGAHVFGGAATGGSGGAVAVANKGNHDPSTRLMGNERAMLLSLIEREQDFHRRMQALKQMVLDREKTIHDLRRLLQAHVNRTE